MNIEFDIDEMIDILKELGHEVKKKDLANKSLRSRYHKNQNEHVVIVEGEELKIEEVFKQELIYHIFKIK